MTGIRKQYPDTLYFNQLHNLIIDWYLVLKTRLIVLLREYAGLANIST